MPRIESDLPRVGQAESCGFWVYQARSHAECVFAQWRGRGLQQLLVRGASKVRCVALLHALAHNMVCGFRLRGRAGLAPA
jgi:hypothetical protein